MELLLPFAILGDEDDDDPLDNDGGFSLDDDSLDFDEDSGEEDDDEKNPLDLDLEDISDRRAA